MKVTKAVPPRNSFTRLFSVLVQFYSLIEKATQAKSKTILMEIQTEDKLHYCVQCNLSFKMAKDLKMHMFQHGGKKSHSCNQCGYSTIKATHLKLHILIHSGEKPFGCTQCNFSCTKAGNFRTHMLTHHGKKAFQLHTV